MQSEQPSGQAQPSLTELVALVNGLQSQLNTQRTELEHQITDLQGELDNVRSRPVAKPGQVLAPVMSSRRRLLKQAFVGVVGATALSVAAAANLPQAQADTFNFNGANGATDQTTVTGSSVAKPLFTFTNSTPNSNVTPNDPTTLPIGVYGKSSESYGLYGLNSTATASGVLGASGTAVPYATNGFFANTAGGVVGSSAVNTGTFGLSQQGVGVEGLSASNFGVAGISQQGVGAVFAGAVDSAANPNQGAAIRLAPNYSATKWPTGTGYNHRQGELFVDKLARIFVCNAGFNGSTGKIVKPTAGTLPGVLDGQVSLAAPSFQQLAPMVIRAGSPAALISTDYNLHTQGEFWYDISVGATYVCQITGATNNAAGVNTDLRTYYGITDPYFVPISSGNARFIPVIRFQLSNSAAPQNGVKLPVNIRSFLVSQGVTGAARAIGVTGFVTIYKALPDTFNGGEYLQTGIGPTGKGANTVVTSPGQNKNGSAITIGLDASGVLNFAVYGTSLPFFTFDITTYYL